MQRNVRKGGGMCVWCLAGLLGWAIQGQAQVGVPAPGAETEVRAVLTSLFSGMREADSTRVRSNFAEGARFASVMERGGTEQTEYSSVDGWIQSVGRSERRWDERVYDVEVRVDDNVALIWAPYTFYLDGALRHCGVNTIALLRLAGTWKITQLADSRRTVGCRDVPPGAGSPAGEMP